MNSPKLDTLAELHAAWWAAVSDPDMPRSQYIEMRRAFYSGFFDAIGTVRAAAEKNDMKTAIGYYQGLYEEACAFFDEDRLKMEQIDIPTPPATM